MRIALFLPVLTFLSFACIAYSKDKISPLNYYSELNKKRGNYAKRNNIANMNRVIFDKRLIAKIKPRLPGLCTEAGKNIDGQFDIVRLHGRAEEYEKVYKASITRLACAMYTCSGDTTPSIFVIYTIPKIADKNGPPGSKCSAGRSPDPKNLCTDPDLEDDFDSIKNDPEAIEKIEAEVSLSAKPFKKRKPSGSGGSSSSSNGGGTKNPAAKTQPQKTAATEQSSSTISTSLPYLLFLVLLLI